MFITVNVLIECTRKELQAHEPFFKAAEFGRYESTVKVKCDETGQQLIVRCQGEDPNCWGWSYFHREWVRRYGTIKH